jgi:hypothetical protein
MLEEAPLQRLYDLTVAEFRNHAHSEATFLAEILAHMRRDPLRTSTRRGLIESLGLDYMMQRKFPKNEILTGVENYLTTIGVAGVDNYQWISRVMDEELPYQQAQHTE